MALRNELKQQGDFLFKHRSYLPVVIILIGLCVYLQSETASKPNFLHLPYSLYEIICLLVCLLGLFIRMLAIGYSADNTSGRNTSVGQIADSINQTGLYSQLRHPLYLGNYFMWLGIAAFTQNFWFLIAFTFMYWVYYERIMYAEEAFLINTYGDNYFEYSKNIPAFVPQFKNWIKPKHSFSFIKIIRQEKSGILNLFLVIFVFKLVRYFVLSIEIEAFWIWGLALSLLWYVVVKLVQKNTELLANDR